MGRFIKEWLHECCWPGRNTEQGRHRGQLPGEFWQDSRKRWYSKEEEEFARWPGAFQAEEEHVRGGREHSKAERRTAVVQCPGASLGWGTRGDTGEELAGASRLRLVHQGVWTSSCRNKVLNMTPGNNDVNCTHSLFMKVWRNTNFGFGFVKGKIF